MSLLLTETWIRATTTTAELIDSTSPAILSSLPRAFLLLIRQKPLLVEALRSL